MSDDNLTGNNQFEISRINELIFLDIKFFDDLFTIPNNYSFNKIQTYFLEWF